ncbi:hypothetical protein [Lacticaseibacillus mingshuiensis]|uniref:Uncharacterized protein n=1 Tax=Lacticaseibacillus mingshuiensis TaxID=2799574 RepID=A0ABW4CJM2_9LACO|nr:hypothetical protein [Lacticaseibacillus mingshuiensis]
MRETEQVKTETQMKSLWLLDFVDAKGQPHRLRLDPPKQPLNQANFQQVFIDETAISHIAGYYLSRYGRPVATYLALAGTDGVVDQATVKQIAEERREVLQLVFVDRKGRRRIRTVYGLKEMPTTENYKEILTMLIYTDSGIRWLVDNFGDPVMARVQRIVSEGHVGKVGPVRLIDPARL